MLRRPERVSKRIKEEISALLERKINDPRLHDFISVTKVSVSSDLKYAKVFVSILGDEADKKDMLAGFNAASGFFRRELSSRLKLRYMPQLSFHYDDSIEQGEKLLRLIEKVSHTS